MIRINTKFRDLIPPLSQEEFSQLEANCLSDGIMHPIITWQGAIVDGHNRYNIATKHNLPYQTESKEFDSEGDAIIWIIKHQFGRRNLNAYNRGLLALEMKEVFREKAKENLKQAGESFGRGIEKPCQNSDNPIMNNRPIDTKKEIAKIANVSHDTIAKVEKIKEKATPEIKEQLVKGDISINKAYQKVKSEEKKEERRQDIRKQVEQIEKGELPELKGLFDVVSVDPPWPYGREYDPDGSRVANPYPEMSIQQIKGIDIHAKNDSVLFLWTTHAFLKDAFDIANQWGFEYKATIVWDKEKMGMGAWLRMQCEFCLLCIKGKPFWDNTKHRDIIRSSRREHSRKPDEFYTLVSQVCEGRKLEYFSREAREGWEIFGNDISKF